MTSFQKVIKYLALALAVTIIISIISGIFYGTARIINILQPNKNNYAKEMVDIDVSNRNKTSMDIELSNTNLTIKTGDRLEIKTNNHKIKCKENDQHLSIAEKSNTWLSDNDTYELVITIPNNHNFSNVEIENGAGIIAIEELSANNLSLELGAGKVEIDNLTVLSEIKIEGGAGKIDIKSGTINNLELDMGVGKFLLNSTLKGNNKIDAGVGEITLNVNGFLNEYMVKSNKGIGSIKIDGEEVSNDATLGTGPNNIKINGGIGNISINFNS